jgi:DNA replication protein DnaC
MNGVIELFQIMAENSNLKVLSERTDSDYIGKDGLLYCGKCNSPRQCITKLNGQTFVCGCLCECRSAKKKYDEAYEKAQRVIARNKKSANIPAVFQTAKLADIDNLQHRKYAYNYSEKFEQMGNRGLLLYGDVGTGKSFMAACIAKILLNKGYSVKWTTTLEFVDKGCFFSESEYKDFVESIAYPDLLIVDDLGAERNTEFAVARVQEMIDRRSASGKPMIVTTNLDVDMMINEQNIARKRTYDRVLETCYPVLFRGKSYRMKKANENFSGFGKLLNE